MRTLIAALLLFPSLAHGAFNGDFNGTAAGTFLALDTDPRAAALGESRVLGEASAAAVRANPASLGGLRGVSLSLFHLSHIESTYLERIAIAGAPTERWALGVSFLAMSYGEIPKTDATGTPLGQARPRDKAFTFAGAYVLPEFPDFIEGLTAGVNLTHFESRVVERDRAWTGSLGLATEEQGDLAMRWGILAENVFGEVRKEDQAQRVPITYRAGFSLAPSDAWYWTLEGVAPFDADPFVIGGMERNISLQAGPSVSLRLGVNTRSIGVLAGPSGVTMGFGIKTGSLGFDYALRPFGDMGWLQRVAVTLRFGGSTPLTTPQGVPVEAAAPPAPLPQPSPRELSPIPPPPEEPKDAYQDRIDGAMALTQQAKAEDAKKEWLALLVDLPPSDGRRVQSWERLGYIAAKQGDVRTAKKYYQKAVDEWRRMRPKESRIVNAYLGLAYCFESESNRTQAANNYRRARRLTTDARTRATIDKKLAVLSSSPAPEKQKPARKRTRRTR